MGFRQSLVFKASRGQSAQIMTGFRAGRALGPGILENSWRLFFLLVWGIVCILAATGLGSRGFRI